jgi:hypothetical protein
LPNAATSLRLGALDARRVSIRSALGDGDWILGADLPGRRQALGALLKGEKKRALELLATDPLVTVAWVGVASYVPIHYAAGNAGAAVAYYDDKIGSPAAAIAARNACTCSIVSLLLALKEAGHKDYKDLLAAWKAALAEQRAAYSNSGAYLRDLGDVAALEGDFAVARSRYTAAIDAGWRSALFLDPAYLAPLTTDPGFDALRARMKYLINKERTTLGLAPL